MQKAPDHDYVLVIEGNTGQITLSAASPQAALKRARQIFPKSREMAVAGTAGNYVVQFKVGFDHNKALLKRARRLAAMDLTRQDSFNTLSPVERYMALLYAQLTGKPTYLGNRLSIGLAALKANMLATNQVAGPGVFADYDIAVYNLVELQERGT